ncbi:glycosyltransferase family 2 protein [Flavobacterium sp. N3904]|uniref:glycosyltransferase family 2 protein n=1 Tax=Flavobacterium sp. N3904 TaxID=2986835 RepID=UPI0022245FF4|nr:glycosyltransferase family 2 protein [Flavobacterium sp. N3904]
MKKISVITINYNDNKGLYKTINSVLNQTYKDFEFIIIDGGSTDGSKELIEQHSKQVDYWISETDTGVFNAMNKGIKVATGDFVIFMNGGDCFYNSLVLEEIEPLLIDDFDIYYGDNFKETPSSKRLKTYPEKLNFSFFYTSSINHQSTFIRKSLFEKYFYYNENYKIASDWEFFIYTICHLQVPYKYLNKTIAIYDFTGISSNPKFSMVYKEEKNRTYKKYFAAFYEDYKNVSELKSKRYLQFAYIKKFKFAWKITKAFVNLVLFFLPKMPK